MIRYTLTCEDGHSFESWFASAGAYDALRQKDMIVCAACGSTEVSKSLMSPSVSTSEKRPAEGVEEKLKAFRKEVESKADYVGRDFAREAREIHEGVQPERSIYGETTPQEARSLVEDGVPVLPLPFTPRRKQN